MQGVTKQEVFEIVEASSAAILDAIQIFATNVDDRFDRLEGRMEVLEGRVDTLESTVDSIDRRMVTKGELNRQLHRLRVMPV